ncbi:MAG: hypothetical protein HY711_10250 [Candidatus Melainabacteria bacterium]|nr:hypothetical protein [Candidatus Melainabacteria bacterium]
MTEEEKVPEVEEKAIEAVAEAGEPEEKAIEAVAEAEEPEEKAIEAVAEAEEPEEKAIEAVAEAEEPVAEKEAESDTQQSVAVSVEETTTNEPSTQEMPVTEAA